MYESYQLSCFSELLGTFVLSLGVASGTYYDGDGSQKTNYILTLSVIFIAILMNAKIGGGDFNPGVTLAKYLSYEGKRKKILGNLLLNYTIYQCIGALCGFLYYAHATNGAIVFKLRLSSQTSFASGFAVEFTASFFTYFFIILIDQNMTITNYPFKLFSCMCSVALGMAIGGNTSGAGLNPAVGLGCTLTRLFRIGDIKELNDLWIFIFAPLLASFVASNAFFCIKDVYYSKNTSSS